MSELSPEAKALFRAAREAYSPDAQTLAEIRAALHARTGAGAGATLANTNAKLVSVKLAAGTAVALLTAGALIWSALFAGATHRTSPASGLPAPPAPGTRTEAPQQQDATNAPEAAARVTAAHEPAREARARSRPSRPPRSINPPAAVPLSGPQRPSPAVSDSVPDSDSDSESLPVPAHAPSSDSISALLSGAELAPPPDTLAAELALLRSARSALDNQAPARALAALDRHTIRYPTGTLRQERLAMRVLALCALDRRDEARATADQLRRIAPSSPHLARLPVPCAAPQP